MTGTFTKVALFHSFFLLFSLHLHSSLSADPLDQIAKNISKSSQKLKNKQIAVLPFPNHDGKENEGSTIVAERLITKLVELKKLQVVERALLDKVFHELKLHHSGIINQESAKQLGNILGVEALVTGTLIDMGNDQVEVNARLIQTESGLVLNAASQIITKEWREKRAAKVTPAQPADRQNVKQETKTDSDRDVSDKMSAFFHSRKYTDPRFSNEPDRPSEPEIEEPQSAPTPASQDKLVFTNANPALIPSLMNEEIFDSPETFFPNLPNDKNEKFAEEIAELNRAWTLFRNEKWGQSTEEFHQIKDEFHHAGRLRLIPLAQVYLAESLYRQGMYQEAVREARQAARMSPNPRLRGYALYTIARSSDELGKKDLATDLYREIVQNFPFEEKLIRAAGGRIHHRSR